MGKKKESGGIGRSLIKDRFGGGRKKKNDDSHLHTSELGDGYDWNRINLKSVTDENTLDEFLATAELAGTEFTAEKLNVKFVSVDNNGGLLNTEEEEKVNQIQSDHKTLLTVPRRPEWDEFTTAAELDRKEKDSFLDWRRQLAELQDIEGLVLTPFEKNIEFWRQLWRVIERSDVVVQIVDARNPLLFRCEDLERYVKEVNEEKENLILVNKADFLSDEQRQKWVEYFDSIGIYVAFWSARLEAEKTEVNEEEDEEEGVEEEEVEKELENPSRNLVEETAERLEDLNVKEDKTEATSPAETTDKKASGGLGMKNTPDLLDADGLIALFRNLFHGKNYTSGVTTIGLVGYPNVGKSSTINTIIKAKKVAVSATPGKTKHFQTIYLDTDLLLCDCPGLVMPTFVMTKAHMVLNGILPVDQMRDYAAPTALLCKQIGRSVLEGTYGIMLPAPPEGEDENRPATAHEFLGAHACMRGYMTHKGIPDFRQSSVQVLKDYTNGKLLYCQPPPGVSDEQFKAVTVPEKFSAKVDKINQNKATGQPKPRSQAFDTRFFVKRDVHAGTMGVKGVVGYTRTEGFTKHCTMEGGAQAPTPGMTAVNPKPWKRHNNRKKKEKLRRLHRDLDA
ncbi:hypothetical protein CAPTEDRAFT_149684 [Capitella teleta]|uniref:Large subunit GTPase 1 homolog n=1 Tax=Capitella teleta TaxID=283909 RepID=R7VIP8_CAPTE|nr:hypothetical protein CAPTEDRAFT_149684 [Capitella teleta]|eukprot:ELU18504.1 hypothetical protein CAPTEDRAFT_149684 [Capitella teleta]